MRTISIINLKGGTGKTVTTVNLASALAEKHGQRVLVIDCDPQHNASSWFGVTQDDALGVSTADLLRCGAGYWPDFVTRTGREGIDLIPATFELITADIASAKNGEGAYTAIRALCETLRQDDAYDFVLIDCPPSFTAASVAACVASDAFIVPIKIDAFAIEGFAELHAQISGIYRANGGQPDVRLLLTMMSKTSVCEEGERLIRRTYPDWTCKTTIRRSVTVDRSTFERRPIYEYYASQPGADYLALAEEVLGNG